VWSSIRPFPVTSTIPPRFESAPGPRISVPETEGSAGVRQGGQSCHSSLEDAADAVRGFADTLCQRVDGARDPSLPSLPTFNHAQWCRADGGENFITPHRDPDTAGGVIAVVTIRGQALFRIWDRVATIADGWRPRHAHAPVQQGRLRRRLLRLRG
jgi:hypothetical protein